MQLVEIMTRQVETIHRAATRSRLHKSWPRSRWTRSRVTTLQCALLRAVSIPRRPRFTAQYPKANL